MKKFLLLTLFVFTAGLFAAHAQPGSYQQMFSGFYFYNNIDGYRLISTETWDFTEGTAADSTLESTTEYEFNADEVNIINSNWMDDGFVMESKIQSYIRSQSEMQLDSTMFFSYDTVTGDWNRNMKFIYHFDGNVQTGTETLMADSLTGEWMSLSQTEFMYDNSGYLTSEVSQSFIEDSGKFIASTKTDYYVTSTGRIDSTKSYYWVEEENDWMMVDKTDYFYTDDDLLDYEVGYSLDVFTMGFSQQSKTTYLYNSEGNQVSQTSFTWSNTIQDWSASSKDSIVYANGVRPIVQITYQDPFAFGGFPFSKSEKSAASGELEINELVLTSKTYFKYEEASGIQNDIQSTDIVVYPNPADDYINIKTNYRGNGTVKMFDLRGSLIFEEEVVNETTSIPVQNFKKGSYLLRVKTPEETHSQIVIIN